MNEPQAYEPLESDLPPSNRPEPSAAATAAPTPPPPAYAAPAPSPQPYAAPAPTAGYTANTYMVQLHGVEQGPFPLEHVRELARSGQLNASDPVSFAGQPWVPAASAPGIFSGKSWIAAVLLSFFLGGLGVDRFYLGYIGLGVAKLLLGWLTLGIWPLIDFILILLRKVHDANGLALR